MKLQLLSLCLLLTLAGCGDYLDTTSKSSAQPQPDISVAVPQPTTVPITIGSGVVPDTGATTTTQTFLVPQLTSVPGILTPAPVLVPVSSIPDANPLSVTGSLGLEEAETPVILAQYQPQYQQNPGFYDPKVMGLNSQESVAVAVPKPPLEASPCVSASIIIAPIMAQEHQYNNWWLLASLTNTKTFVNFNQQQFYWATQISDQEVAVVPTGVAVGPEQLKNWKIDTGFAVLSYQLINVLQVLRKFPTNPDEPCVG